MQMPISDKNSKEINHATLRHHLYLDCMDIRDLIALDEVQIKMIVNSILQTRNIRIHNSKIFSMMDDICLEYQRMMCLFAWQKLIDINPGFYQRILPFNEKHQVTSINKTIYEMNKIKTGIDNFQTIKRNVHRNILYVIPEVYDAMSRVVESCETIINMSLFGTNHGKSLKLNEFEEQQLQTSATVIKYLNQQWIERIVQSVRMCLRDIGKGCFDLNQKTSHIYDIIKLKRFMELKVSIMQSALSTLIKNSTWRYLYMLITPTNTIGNIESDFKWGSNLTLSHFPPTGNVIFQIELTINEKGACYTTDLSQFVKTIIRLLDDAIIQCHQIRPAQVFLLSKLIFPPELCLSTIGLLDDNIVDAKHKLTVAYNRSIILLEAYAKEYNKYLELYNLNVEEYIQLKNADLFDIVQIREEIAFQLAAMEEVLNNLPGFILIGPFKVMVSPLRKFLADKRRNLATRILDMLTQHIRARLDNFSADYANIEMKLQKRSRDIEELIELREYMECIPLNVKELNKAVRKIETEVEVLDLFLWNMPDEDFQIKWRTFAYPLRIEEQLEQTKGYLKEAFEKFQKLQIDDQANLSDRIGSLSVNLINIALEMDVDKVHEYAIEVKRTWKSLRDCEEQSLHLNERQRLFQMPIVSYEHLTKLIRDFEPYKNLWCTASDWLKAQEMWLENPLSNIDSDQMEITLNELQKSILRSAKFFHDQPKIAVIVEDISKKIESFKPYVELVQSLRNPGVKEQHLEKIAEHTKITALCTPNVTLANLLDSGIMNYKNIIMDIAGNAAKEYSIEAALEKMMNEWANTQMDIIPYKNTETFIMKISDETLVMLDDHILNTQQLGFSPFRGALENTIIKWERKLKLTREVLSEWIIVQKSWMYLEPIFRSDDISRQLPVEAKKFYTMERNWRRIMKNANENPNILILAPDNSLLENLKECTALMDFVQKNLADYLETKRMIFPRFYFLSDDELLEILAQTKNVRAVQPYLNKCFENMKQLRFEEDMEITRMYSAENEEVYLRPSIYPVGNVENWLGRVEESMRNTLREIIRDALATIEITPRNQWVYMWPGQIVICAGQTYWAYHIEDAIKNDKLKSYYEMMLHHLDDLRKLVRGQPTDIQRLMLEALITIQVHERDVLVQLMNKKVRNVNDFNWISQLRYYWIDDSHLFLRVVNAQFPYGYEYLGNNGRLVITPLTDRCYLTLTGALHLKFGGATAGPAGTGKTETTKDLAKAFAVQCVVFNCSDQLDFISMGKFFRGLASSGAWACFDEFNRIDIEVLSVIAQQILTIQKAQQIGAENFLFEGIDVILKSSCSIFVTMNPGYAGRTELPDNLKALFRPVAMMIPNYALIAEISLFSYGFFDAKLLASKITTTFKLSSEQLSAQDHYDFGMRAVKTVIAFAGNLKREQQHLDEFQICLRALKDVNVPKFLKSDLILFEGIVMDIFPGLVEIPDDHSILEESIRQSIREMGLKEVDEYIKKIIQLYETTTVRHGLMLVGPTGSGKTKVM
ncbi:hypothetical protein PV328_010182 [Microctonus aethiopoides]|uniref:Dynein heavy chain n=1 Tax=Microctonus aethiopoides TaxID=144406 RepID=A0AA39F041_9HYME|nr:hypothetical protein PV328_010182 [Microctonus aethiopoides]